MRAQIVLLTTLILEICYVFCEGFVAKGRAAPAEAFLFATALAAQANKHIQLRNEALIRETLQLTEELRTVRLCGETSLPAPGGRTVSCAVLSSSLSEQEAPCLLVPLDTSKQLELLRATTRTSAISQVQLIAMNALAVNRDGGLFDNLPYTTWTVDPCQKNSDAAGNPILDRFHLGKRDTYNRLLGKDWMFSSPTTSSNIILDQVQTMLEKDGSSAADSTDLRQRLEQLRVRELQMDLAECEYQLAIARNSNERMLDEQVIELEARQKEMLKELQETAKRDPPSTDDEGTSEKTKAPYPGASGYDVYSSKDDTATKCSNSYEMFRDILRDQMKAEVIGAMLERSSLLDDTFTLGGLLVLRRLEATKDVLIMGENVEIKDETETYGNSGVTGGTVCLVECDTDEAIGMSLACKIPLQIENSVWERCTVMATRVDEEENALLPSWRPNDPELSIGREGDSGSDSPTERLNPVRAARAPANLFDVITKKTKSPEKQSNSGSLFPTDNPLQSLEEYDMLDNDGKARTLFGMSNFDGRLPRPRVLKDTEKGESNALDALLLPLVDEAVRRQYLLRDAEKRRDWDRVEELQNSKSRRQVAIEKAEAARATGEDDVAEWWDTEAEFLASLRADATQDEGSYSRFLDRDDWYERQRANQAKRINKKSFGTLLDGLE